MAHTAADMVRIRPCKISYGAVTEARYTDGPLTGEPFILTYRDNNSVVFWKHGDKVSQEFSSAKDAVQAFRNDDLIIKPAGHVEQLGEIKSLDGRVIGHYPSSVRVWEMVIPIGPGVVYWVSPPLPTNKKEDFFDGTALYSQGFETSGDAHKAFVSGKLEMRTTPPNDSRSIVEKPNGLTDDSAWPASRIVERIDELNEMRRLDLEAIERLNSQRGNCLTEIDTLIAELARRTECRRGESKCFAVKGRVFKIDAESGTIKFYPYDLLDLDPIHEGLST